MDETTGTKDAAVEHIEYVDKAAIEILGSTCGLELELIDDPGNLTEDGLIIAIISLVGDVGWSIFLGFPPKTAVAAASKFAGFDIPFESDDMGDAVGELANMVAGHVKIMLDQRSVKADISLPSVIRAEHLEVLSRHTTVARKKCFNTTAGKLWIGVTVGGTPGIIA